VFEFIAFAGRLFNWNMKTMKKNQNPYEGSSFDDLLKEDGTYEECSAVAIKRGLAWQFECEMEKQHITKKAMAERMETSRS